MQNWILDLDFYKSASYLDRNRLQANIYENIQGLASLLGVNDKLYRLNKTNNKIEQLGKRSVANHPNIKRWAGFELCYFHYISEHHAEWLERGYTTRINLENILMLSEYIELGFEVPSPNWINDDLIKQYKQILLKKNNEYYSKIFT